MADRQMACVQVKPDLKAEWEEYAEENFENLSHLIRHSVNKEVRGDSGGSSSGDSTASLRREDIDRMERMLERFEHMERAFRGLDDTVQLMRQEVMSDPEGSDLAAVALQKLPEYESEAINLDTLANRMEAHKDVVRHAVEHLEEDTAQLGSKEISGERHYWRGRCRWLSVH